MFILIWNGLGVLAFGPVVAALLVYSVIARKGRPDVALLAAGVSLFVGGIGCAVLGRLWNRDGTQHSLYWIPLQGWGYAYLPFGLMLSVVGAYEIIRKMG